MDVSHDPRVRHTVDSLRQAFAGSPWLVESTPEGVWVGIDIVDARWWEMLRRTFVATAFDGVVVDSSFNSETGRSTLRQVLTQQGWNERMGRDQKIGLWFAVGGIALAVVAAVVVSSFS